MVIAAGVAVSAKADAISDFYKGKKVTLLISSSVGGGYNRYARTVGRHIGKYIPGNPSIIAKNMPGAGGLKATNYLYKVAPQDGSTIGSIQNTALFEPLWGNKLARFDVNKFNWLGSANSEVSMIVVWHTAPVKTIQDLLKTEITVGATGAASTPAFFGRLQNALLGTKMKIINGYKGMTTAFFAMEKGEVQGFPSAFYSSLKSRWGHMLDKKQIRILVQVALKKHPELPHIPLAHEIASSKENQALFKLASAPLAIGRPSLAPPGVPKDRVKALRAAFAATMESAGYIKDAKKQRLETGNWVSGSRIDKIIKSSYNAPRPVVARLTVIQQELQKLKRERKKPASMPAFFLPAGKLPFQRR
jgi:tripartite-type tricarboxylate transporter receptor subunit TctC